MDPQRHDDDQVHDRRGLIAATVAAVTLGAVSMPSRPANAQALGGFLGSVSITNLAGIIALLTAIRDWLSDIFGVIFGDGTSEIPTETEQTTDGMDGMLGRAGADSYSSLATIPGAIERSYPLVMPPTPQEQLSQAMFLANATRMRATSALEASAWLSAAQPIIASGERGLVADANSSESLIEVLRVQTAMLGSIAQRLGHLAQAVTTTNELLADQALRDAENRRATALARGLYIDTEGTAPPVQRPVQ